MVLVQVEYVSTGEDEELVQVVELCTGYVLSKVSITLVIACTGRECDQLKECQKTRSSACAISDTCSRN